MRKVLVLAALLAAGCTGRAKPFGVGFIVGSPEGVSIKGWTETQTAVVAAFAWPGDDFYYMHLDYLFHNFNALRADEGDFALYLGVGGRALFVDAPADDVIGVRFPFGIEYIIEGGYLDIFLEVVPTLVISPGSDVDVDAGFGIRYFF